MKSISILLVSIITSCSVYGQNLSFSTDQHIEYEMFSSSIGYYDIKFTLPQVDSVTFRWTKIASSMPNAWQYSLCDLGGCYVGVPSGGMMSPISMAEAQAGVEGFFKLTLNPMNEARSGLIQLYVYDSTDYAMGDTVSFFITYTDTNAIQTTGIEQITSTDIKVYPNPASSKVTVFASTDSPVQIIKVHNAIGKLVSVENELTDTDSHVMDVSAFDKGVYFLTITSKAGATVTRRLVIN